MFYFLSIAIGINYCQLVLPLSTSSIVHRATMPTLVRIHSNSRAAPPADGGGSSGGDAKDRVSDSDSDSDGSSSDDSSSTSSNSSTSTSSSSATSSSSDADESDSSSSSSSSSSADDNKNTKLVHGRSALSKSSVRTLAPLKSNRCKAAIISEAAQKEREGDDDDDDGNVDGNNEECEICGDGGGE